MKLHKTGVICAFFSHGTYVFSPLSQKVKQIVLHYFVHVHSELIYGYLRSRVIDYLANVSILHTALHPESDAKR